MTSETGFIALLRALPTHPAARGLLDDAAVFGFAGRNLVLTQDAMIEGVHFLVDDPPETVGWKLAAVNLSDLAAKAAKPVAAMMVYSLGEDDWDAAFVRGLGEALEIFDCPLIGGDSVRAPRGSARQLSLTAIGEADQVPDRAGASPGDELWVSGTLGDAGLGLRGAKGEIDADPLLLDAYRRPQPELALGRKLAPLVSAMMDVSDGLLIDARRMAEASGVRLVIESIDIPLSPEFIALRGDTRESSIEAATLGDDYRLLFTAPARSRKFVETAAEELGATIHCVGLAEAGSGIALQEGGRPLELPEHLGWEH